MRSPTSRWNPWAVIPTYRSARSVIPATAMASRARARRARTRADSINATGLEPHPQVSRLEGTAGRPISMPPAGWNMVASKGVVTVLVGAYAPDTSGFDLGALSPPARIAEAVECRQRHGSVVAAQSIDARLLRPLERRCQAFALPQPLRYRWPSL